MECVAFNQTSPRIVVMDDDSRLLADLRDIAGQLGCEIVCPTLALPRDGSQAVDAAVINLVMANGSSDRIIRDLLSRGTAVIIRSSLMSNAVRRVYPAVQVLHTPCSAEELRSALIEALKPT